MPYVLKLEILAPAAEQTENERVGQKEKSAVGFW